MRAPKTIASRSPLRRSAKPPASPPISKHAEELMELAVEAAQSRHLLDFLEQFALRATRMLDAIWGGVAVYRGRETELYSGKKTNGATLSACREWLIASARESRNEVDTRAVPKEIAAAFEGTAEPAAAVFVRIAGSDNERLGTLCLIRKRKGLDGDDKRLLHALASHAQLAEDRGNGKRTALPLLPRYQANARRIRGGLGGADFSRVDFADTGSFRRRYAHHSRAKRHYRPARGGAQVSRAV